MASVHKDERLYKGVKKSRWIVRYKSGGVHRQKTFHFKKQADAFKIKVLHEMQEGTHIPITEKLSVTDLCGEFMRFSETRRKDGRIGGHHYRDMDLSIQKSILPAIGDRKFADLKYADVEALYVRMTRQGKLAPTTAKKRIDVLRAVEDFALKRKLVVATPVRDFRAELRGIAKPRVRTFSPEQISKLLQSLETRPVRGRISAMAFRKTVIHIAVFCGLRLGEIMGLTRPCVDLDAGIIRVRHNLSIYDGLKAPKTRAGVRDVPLPAHVVGLLREWMARYSEANDRDLIFQHGGSPPPRGCEFHTNHWRRVLKWAGLENLDDSLHFHALRHFTASWLIGNGMNIPDVASLLGHAKYDLTLQVYAHSIVGGNRRREIVETMAKGLIALPASENFVNLSE